MLSILLNLNLVLLVLVYAAMLPLLAPEKSAQVSGHLVGRHLGRRRRRHDAVHRCSPMARFGRSTGSIRSAGIYAFDIVLRQYFDHSVPFAILTAVLIVAAIVARLAGARGPAGDVRSLLLSCAAWIVIPTAVIVVYSAIIEPIYYPRYLIFTAPAAAVVLAVCIVTIARKPWPIAGVVLLFAVAALPNYLFTQRWPYAKEGWDYSQVADLISCPCRTRGLSDGRQHRALEARADPCRCWPPGPRPSGR